MGSSAPKSETIVKGGKPVVVREWLSPEYLKSLSGLSEYYGNRALQERSTYQDVVNRTMSAYGRQPTYEPLKTDTGEVIAPGQVSTPYDVSQLVTAAQESSMFKPPRANKPKQKNEREAYNKAITDVKSNELYRNMPRMTGGG